MSEAIDTCLQCGQSRAEVKANDTYCATVTGYETIETLDEWDRHHWRDWSDAELKRHGLDPSKWNAHRRTGIYDLEWPARESHCLRVGHTEPDADWAGVDVCPVCYVNLKEQREAGETVRMREKSDAN